MANIENLITLTGNLTDDPEIKHTKSGTAVANFTIAYTPRRRDPETDEFVDGDTLFAHCSYWKDEAVNFAKSASKGARVHILGRLEADDYDDPNYEDVVQHSFSITVTEAFLSTKFGVYTGYEKTAKGAASGGSAKAKPKTRAKAKAKPKTDSKPAETSSDGDDDFDDI